MKRTNTPMDRADIGYYPPHVPSIADHTKIFSVSRVVMSGASPILEHFWRKGINNVVGWRMRKAMVQNPAFVGDTNAMYIISSNLPSPLGDGRVNGEMKSVMGVGPREVVGAHSTVDYGDGPTWTRIKHYFEVDNLRVELLNSIGEPLPATATPPWMVEIELLTSVEV